MKAIRVKFVGFTTTLPARWIAEDGDGNKAFLPTSKGDATDAVRLLCEKMGWTGELIGGGFKNDHFFVFTDSEPRVNVGGAQGLSDEQSLVIAELRVANCYGVAEATEAHWRRGEHYYIDERVSIGKRLRARFDKINDALLARANERFDRQKEGK